MSTPPAQNPQLLAMEISANDESEYRLLIDGRIRYLSVAARTLDIDTLRFLPDLLEALPPLHSPKDWTVAYITRDPNTSELKVVFSEEQLTGVQNIWHPQIIDCLRLKRVKQLTPAVFEASLTTLDSSPPPIFIAKIARWEWEIPRIERETQVYYVLQGTGMAPRFLGHIAEHGRVIGVLLEKVERVREAGIEDLASCEEAVERLHTLGFVHGDLNRFNFLVGKDSIKLIDFENSNPEADRDDMRWESEGLAAQLQENTGRGGGFRI